MSATPNVNLLKIKGNKFDATAAPTATDDSASGYYVGSIWVDVTNDRVYVCVDNTATSAIWKLISKLSVQETTSTATFTIDADKQSEGVLTAMAVATTIAAPTGSPSQGQNLIFRFKDDGTSRTLTWNAIFRVIGVTLPTATTASKTLYVGCKYNSTDTKWDVVAVKEEV